MKFLRVWTGICLGLSAPFWATVGAVGAAEKIKPCSAKADQKGKLRLQAESSTYDVREKWVQVKGVKVWVYDACGQELLMLKAATGVYAQEKGRLELSTKVIAQTGEVQVAAREAVFLTRESLLELKGPLAARTKTGEEKTPITFTAQAATLRSDTGDITLTGPLRLKGKDLAATAENVKGNYRDQTYTLCCKVRGRHGQVDFSGRAFAYDAAQNRIETQDGYAVRVHLKQKAKPAAGPPPAKDGKKTWMPAMRLDVKEVTVRGKGFVYDGGAGWFKTLSAAKVDFGKDNGGGRAGVLSADLKNQLFTLSKGLSLTLGQATLTAEGGVYDTQKRLLNMAGGVHLKDTTPGQERDLKARHGWIHFRPEGALITLGGQVDLEMTVDTNNLSGSLNL